ncbi:Dcm Site-specific DNA methylase [uncultured Caudovirales phage]|uniref:Cytosine-specific methyltransferase n=1 Tax=uncultured Caudovirales phage TaxID=2100421 RepID=A0A6J7WQ43_9CAUD|nr:Dcm Site-specific DNA methylase [uncultured Caudovirales phage]CAB5216940.1 Dcm Site-specific DNA methylase [uncultured Caudovirales phage]
MRFLSLFSGIGGMDHGFIKAGFECAGYVELDKFAHKAFQILHDPNEVIPNEFDVRNVTDGFVKSVGHIDAIIGGFPCQSFSIAGKRAGFKDVVRGTLFFEIVRITEIARPSYIIIENVKGLINHDGGQTFKTILQTLDELGYDCEWQVLNSKNFGVPQNRERVFIIASARESSGRKVFPISRENNSTIEVVGMLDIKGKDQIRRVYSTDHLSPCLSTMQGGGQEPKIILEPFCVTKEGNSYYLTTRYDNGLLPSMFLRKEKTAVKVNGYRIRKLTPLECFRLQSYPDEWYHTLKQQKFSDSQLYKMAGNGVTSNVAYEIARRIL